MSKPFPPLHLTNGGGLDFVRLRKCHNCKNDFVTKGPAKYCENCREAHKKKRMSDYHKKRRQREKTRIH